MKAVLWSSFEFETMVVSAGPSELCITIATISVCLLEPVV